MSIADAGLIRGWNDRTTDQAYDYGRWNNPQNVRVYDQNTGGYRPLEQGETVPAGTPISIYTDQSGAVSGSAPSGSGGVETTTGTDLAWQNHEIAMGLLAAQDRMRQLDQVDANLQQQHAQFVAGLQQERDIARMDAQNAAAQIGVSAANVQLNAKMAEMDAKARAAQLNFDQRLAEVQQQREDAKVQLASATQRAQQEFNAADLNAQQRQQVAQLEQNALQMLADRSGPQDWVKYNNLLEGLSGAEAGTPASEITVDPLARLKDVYQEFDPDLSKFKELEDYQTPGAGSINQPFQAPTAGGSWEGTLSDALGRRSAGDIGAQAPSVEAPTSTRLGGGITGGGEGTTQAPSPGQSGVPQKKTSLEPQPEGISPGIANTEIQPGRNLITIPRGGGISHDRFDPRLTVHYLNDQGQYTELDPGQTVAGDEAVWITAPEDWNPGDISYGNDNRTYETGTPATGGGGISSQNVMDTISRSQPREYTGPESGSIMDIFPDAGPSIQGDGYSTADIRFPPRDQWTPEQTSWYEENLERPINAARGATVGPGQIAYAGDSRSGKKTGNEEAVIPIGGSAMILSHEDTERMRRRRPGVMQRMAGGGIVSDTVGADDPNAFTYRMYDEETLYNQPFMRQIRGEQPGRSFGNFGGGNVVGRWDLPSNMSIQRYSQLQPTAQKMLQGAYQDPQTGLAWEDVLASAQRGSVGTRIAGGGSAYGGR